MDINTELCNFLNSHKLISLNALEKKLGIPQSTLSKSLLNKQAIPTKWHWALILELIDYGFKYNGFTLEKDELGDIFGRKWVKNIKEKEHSNKNGTWFSYTVEEIRMHASAITDL